MKIKKPVIIILGEPNSVFTEILSKVLNKKSVKKKNKLSNNINRITRATKSST